MRFKAQTELLHACSMMGTRAMEASILLHVIGHMLIHVKRGQVVLRSCEEVAFMQAPENRHLQTAPDGDRGSTGPWCLWQQASH